MKRWWLIIALLLSIGINVGILASRAWPPRDSSRQAAPSAPGPDRAERPAPQIDRVPPVIYRLVDDLGLRGESRKAFIDIQRRFLERTISARTRVGRLQAELRRELAAAEPDRAAVDEFLDQLGAAYAELERAFVDDLLSSRELLDAEQEKLFLRFLGRIRQHRKEDERRLRDPRRWDRLRDRRGAGPESQELRRRPPVERRQPPSDRPVRPEREPSPPGF
ncbi:MAG: hypothetical protein GY856_39620 [bacterium]|nr:hypothetical protein [bacterium]